MNSLRNRTSSRAVSRPNMLKALARIEAELGELMAAAPMTFGPAQHEVETDRREQVKDVLDAVAELWGARR